ncbi:hypothetical protein [Bacillus thuringiensis]|uniref:hypothetical protein n=1 Tax=Bacillus thuringiensis TaxID=1428 RepID=UPI0011A2DDF9|nr:hypothetical protein [Bacillus thuringiensis]
MELNREFVVLFKRSKPGSGTIIIGTDKGSVTISVVPNTTESEKNRSSILIEAYLLKTYIAAGSIWGTAHILTKIYVKQNST